MLLSTRGGRGATHIRMSSRWVSLDLVSLLVIQVCLGMRRPITRFYHGWCFGRGCQRLRKVRRAGGSHQKGPFFTTKGALDPKRALNPKGHFCWLNGYFSKLKKTLFWLAGYLFDVKDSVVNWDDTFVTIRSRHYWSLKPFTWRLFVNVEHKNILIFWWPNWHTVVRGKKLDAIFRLIMSQAITWMS